MDVESVFSKFTRRHGVQCYFVTDRDMKWPHVHQPVMALTPNQLEAFVLWSEEKQRPTSFFFCFSISFIPQYFVFSSFP